MLNVLSTHKEQQRGQEETLGGDGYVYGFESGDSFMSMYLSQSLSNGIQ